jgi:iron complex transport system substrate-binding protein
VVSINLCTDQLAMLVAAPGQLVSVSRLAADPRASNLADEAAKLPLNSGAAEQAFLLEPDLVLAGTFTNRLAVDMLRRLGITVEVFPPVRSLADVSATILRLGTLLGQEDRAQAVAADYEAELDRLAATARDLPRDRAAYYYANGYTSGADTLADEILDRAGLDNAARRRGLTGAVRMPLEVLVMERPFVVRTSHISGRSPALAYATLNHPALRAVAGNGREAVVEERWQVCGTPFVTEAIDALIAARLSAPTGGEGE